MSKHRFAAWIVILWLGTTLWTVARAQSTAKTADYSSQLPRIPPTSVEEAQRRFALKDGFRIELVASEPLIADPIAMAFDEDGRLFVVEMRGYSEDPQLNIGRVRLLTDQDGDGRFDTATTYVDGLSWPTAVACYDGGIFIGAAPHITFHKDADGDGKSDNHSVVFRGFGRSNVQGLLNTFKWSVDHRIYGATSSTGATLALSTNGGTKLQLRGRDFAFDPRTLNIEAVSGGGQHGMSFNAWGERFVCSNSDHIQFITYEDRYVQRNPYFAPAPARVSIAADGPQAAVFRASPVEPWRVLRTRLRVAGQVPGPIEGGGTPAGYFTGATGITIYRGNAWPADFGGWAFVCDVGSNLIHRKRLQPHGVTYRAERVDEQSEFLTSSDIWFRPVQLANGPDGTLYVADMCREVIEHPDSLPPMIKRHLDLTSGRDRGRIYRIVPPGFQQPKPVRLSRATAEELVALLDHPNGWHRETAARLLYERGWPNVKEALQALVRQGHRPEGRLRGLYALASAGQLAPEVLEHALADDHPHVRRHAIRLAEPHVNQPAVLAQLAGLTQDPSMIVRYQLAFTCGAIQSDERFQLLTEITKRDAHDAFVRTAIQSSLVDGCGQLLARLIQSPSLNKPGVEILIRSLAAQIGRQQHPSDIQTLAALPAQEPATMAPILVALNPPKDSRLAREMTEGRLAVRVDGVLAWARNTAVDDQRPLPERITAVDALRLAAIDSESETLDRLLAPSQPLPIQRAALAAFSSHGTSQVAHQIISRWTQLSPQLRREASEHLMSRRSWQQHLLEAIEEGRIQTGDVDLARWRSLLKKNSPLSARLDKVAAGLGAPQNRLEVYRHFQSAITPNGNVARGREVFRKHCASCHRLENVGHDIGPNLAAMTNRGNQAILLNVLVPNQEVNPQYVTYVATTRAGRVVSGMISDENATGITLRRENNESDTILRVDLDELTSTGRSLMPENLDEQINPEAMSDLLAYMRSLAP